MPWLMAVGFASAEEKHRGIDVDVTVETVPPTLLLCVQREVWPAELERYREESIALLNDTIRSKTIKQVGPLHFMGPRWNGSERPSVYIVAIPVDTESVGMSAPLFFLRVSAQRCASKRCSGTADTLPAVWDQFITEISRIGLRTTGEWREVLHRTDAIKPSDNLFELQAVLQ